MKKIITLLFSLIAFSSFADTYFVHYNYSALALLGETSKDNYFFLRDTALSTSDNKITVTDVNGTKVFSEKALTAPPIELSMTLGKDTVKVYDDAKLFEVTVPAKIIKKTFGGLVSVFPFYLDTNTKYFTKLPNVLSLVKDQVANVVGNDQFSITDESEIKGGTCMAGKSPNNSKQLTCTLMYSINYKIETN